MAIERATRQRDRSEHSTNAMLDAAMALIVEGGFAALTFVSIGERAGYSRGLVTARFGSKEGLIEELIDRIVNTWNHRNVLPRTKGKPGLAGVEVLLDAIHRQAEADPRGLRVLYALMFEALGADEELRSRFAKFHEVMRTDFARLIAKG
ncbi:MAG: helix-turn-helix domain-containing protein, partial [Acidimicrobiia bacterium]